MPIYEYQCKGCSNQFEQVVLPKTTPQCPACKSQELERLLSHFAVSSEGTRQTNLTSARKQARKTQLDKAHAEHEAMHHHHH